MQGCAWWSGRAAKICSTRAKFARCESSLERPEALDTGSIVLTVVDVDTINRAADIVLTQWANGDRPSLPADYRSVDCSLRVCRLILSLTSVHKEWMGLREKAWRLGP